MPSTAASDETLDEHAARGLLLVAAYERSVGHPSWSADDARWADRAATQAVGEAASDAAWTVERTRLALQRLGAREPALAQALRWRVWQPAWPWGVLVLAMLAGAASESVLGGGFVNLLSLPLMFLLAWNTAIYLALVWRRWRPGAAAGGPWRQALARTLGRGWRRLGETGPLADFASHWARVSGPLTAARLAGLFHLGAAALAIGLVAGWYLRALVFDYRAGWASTLLDPAAVQALLATLFAPARALAGSAAPDLAAVAALRVVPGAQATASAAPWLHLMAATLGLVVVAPRLALAAAAAWRARRLARALMPLPAVVGRRRPAAPAPSSVLLLPHGQTPDRAAAAALQRLVVAAWGEAARPAIAAPVAYGDEEGAGLRTDLPSGPVLLLLDLATTPEAEVHRRLLDALHRPTVLLLDEAGFVRRFGRGERLDQRRAAWAAFAAAAQVPLARVDLDRPDDDASAQALRRAVESLR